MPAKMTREWICSSRNSFTSMLEGRYCSILGSSLATTPLKSKTAMERLMAMSA
jgi:hypothetical protein